MQPAKRDTSVDHFTTRAHREFRTNGRNSHLCDTRERVTRDNAVAVCATVRRDVVEGSERWNFADDVVA